MQDLEEKPRRLSVVHLPMPEDDAAQESEDSSLNDDHDVSSTVLPEPHKDDASSKRNVSLTRRRPSAQSSMQHHRSSFVGDGLRLDKETHSVAILEVQGEALAALTSMVRRLATAQRKIKTRPPEEHHKATEHGRDCHTDRATDGLGSPAAAEMAAGDSTSSRDQKPDTLSLGQTVQDRKCTGTVGNASQHALPRTMSTLSQQGAASLVDTLLQPEMAGITRTKKSQLSRSKSLPNNHGRLNVQARRDKIRLPRIPAGHHTPSLAADVQASGSSHVQLPCISHPDMTSTARIKQELVKRGFVVERRKAGQLSPTRHNAQPQPVRDALPRSPRPDCLPNAERKRSPVQSSKRAPAGGEVTILSLIVKIRLGRLHQRDGRWQALRDFVGETSWRRVELLGRRMRLRSALASVAMSMGIVQELPLVAPRLIFLSAQTLKVVRPFHLVFACQNRQHLAHTVAYAYAMDPSGFTKKQVRCATIIQRTWRHWQDKRHTQERARREMAAGTIATLWLTRMAFKRLRRQSLLRHELSQNQVLAQTRRWLQDQQNAPRVLPIVLPSFTSDKCIRRATAYQLRLNCALELLTLAMSAARHHQTKAAAQPAAFLVSREPWSEQRWQAASRLCSWLDHLPSALSKKLQIIVPHYSNIFASAGLTLAQTLFYSQPTLKALALRLSTPADTLCGYQPDAALEPEASWQSGENQSPKAVEHEPDATTECSAHPFDNTADGSAAGRNEAAPSPVLIGGYTGPADFDVAAELDLPAVSPTPLWTSTLTSTLDFYAWMARTAIPGPISWTVLGSSDGDLLIERLAEVVVAFPYVKEWRICPGCVPTEMAHLKCPIIDHLSCRGYILEQAEHHGARWTLGDRVLKPAIRRARADMASVVMRFSRSLGSDAVRFDVEELLSMAQSQGAVIMPVLDDQPGRKYVVDVMLRRMQDNQQPVATIAACWQVHAWSEERCISLATTLVKAADQHPEAHDSTTTDPAETACQLALTLCRDLSEQGCGPCLLNIDVTVMEPIHTRDSTLSAEIPAHLRQPPTFVTALRHGLSPMMGCLMVVDAQIAHAKHRAMHMHPQQLLHCLAQPPTPDEPRTGLNATLPFSIAVAPILFHEALPMYQHSTLEQLCIAKGISFDRSSMLGTTLLPASLSCDAGRYFNIVGLGHDPGMAIEQLTESLGSLEHEIGPAGVALVEDLTDLLTQMRAATSESTVL